MKFGHDLLELDLAEELDLAARREVDWEAGGFDSNIEQSISRLSPPAWNSLSLRGGVLNSGRTLSESSQSLSEKC